MVTTKGDRVDDKERKKSEQDSQRQFGNRDCIGFDSKHPYDYWSYSQQPQPYDMSIESHFLAVDDIGNGSQVQWLVIALSKFCPSP